jgi:thioredoxin reductase (NADPH)
MKKVKEYTLAIIGGGPAGINVAIAAEKAGIDYIILEKGFLVNSIYNFPVNMTFFSTSKNLEIGDVPFISHTDKPTRHEALEYYRRIVDAYQLNIQYQEEVTGLKKDHNRYQLSTSKQEYYADFVVVATGFYDTPRLLNIPGEDLKKVKHYYDDVHQYIKQKVVVIGGANSACDVALETWQKGAEVTMVVRDSQLYEKTKYWILPNIKNRIKEGSIKAYFNSEVTEIRTNEVDIQTPEGKITLENDVVLAMTGYQPNYTFLESLGLKMGEDEFRTPIHNENSLESNLPGVYYSGVVNGGLHTSKYFIENTRDQGDRIIRDILLKTSIAS